ncbi:MAG: 50S ribosomal protein L11 methyltransferase [Proteobacteria bacterium]|nr:50S ribosomal protein L11 methyltransferase [Pseudomonadota bacterium]
MSDSWKLSLPCTRAEAEAIDAGSIDIDAVLVTTETVEDDVEHWRLDAFTDNEPDADLIAAIRALAPSAAAVVPEIEQLTDQDWVTLSQAGLEPIREGRFIVHTEAHPVTPTAGERAFLINASQAFGTGHHGTTAGCLTMLDRMSGAPVVNAIDLGTGTGLLAFAARQLWPEAKVMATDIDPVAIDVARENAARNGVDRIAYVVADGAQSPEIEADAPFDLIIANILAGPLVAMAGEVAAIAAPKATIVLAGLLSTQADKVKSAYRAVGCAVEESDTRGDWTILRLRAAEMPVTNVPSDNEGRENWARDI